MANLRMYVDKLNANTMRFSIVLDSLKRSRINCITRGEFNHWISSRWGLVQKKNVSPTAQIFNQRHIVVQFMPGRVSLNSPVANYLHLTTYSLAFQLRISKLLSHTWSATKALERTVDRLYSRSIEKLITENGSQDIGNRLPNYRIEQQKMLNLKNRNTALFVKSSSHQEVALQIVRQVIRATNINVMRHLYNSAKVSILVRNNANQILTRQTQQSQMWPTINNVSWHLHNPTKTSFNLQKIYQAGLLAQIIQNSANVVDSNFIKRPQSKMSGMLQEKPNSLNVLISVIGESKQIKFPNQRVQSHAALTDNTNALQWGLSNKTPLYYSTKEMGLVHQLGDALKGLRESVDDQRTKSTATSALKAPPHQIEQLTRRVYDQLKREIRIDKERRGL